MKVQCFEDLLAWREARELTREIYELTRSVSWARDLRLVGQLRSSSASVMANVAEGFERHSAREFHQFLCVAKGSCAEVRSYLYVAQDAGLIKQEDFRRLMNRADAVSRIVGALRAAVERARK
ncbi:MAG: four helix bundle protein [Acidobacteriota bacterium]|nr:four helix bundle protein [Acidobacteriota bacterium]